VPQAEHGHALADRDVDRVDDVAASVDAHGAAHLGAVACEGDHRRALDLAARAQHAGAVVASDRAERPPVE
jgi:hypothetical protein